MTLNPITIKPRTTRTKSLVLTGAKGKHARSDGRNERHDLRGIMFRRSAPLSEREHIEEQLADTVIDPTVHRRVRTLRAERFYSTETPMKAQKVKKPMLPELEPVAEYDEYGRRIIVVVNTDDAWPLVGGNRY